MNKYIITILTALCLCGCNRIIEYHYTTILAFENKSNHTIEIKVYAGNSREKEPWECIIKPNENYSHTKGGDLPWIIWYIMDDGCVVTFDDEIEVDHRNTNIEHNLCDESSYTAKVSGQHDTKTTYTYTFTDEDYERAVAATNTESGE